MTDEQREEWVAYLRELAERLMGIPVMYGTDQGDVERLEQLAGELKKD